MVTDPYHRSPMASTMMTRPIVAAILRTSLASARTRAINSSSKPRIGPTTKTATTPATGHGQ